MTDLRFFELAEEKCEFDGMTLLEYNSTYCIMLCHVPFVDGLYLYQYDDRPWFDNRTEHFGRWHCLRGVTNTNEGFQYIMDLYQMFITNHLNYKKR